MPDLWRSRRQALEALADEAPPILHVLDDLFILVDDCVTALAAVDSTFGRVAGLYLAKARNLALGCYSLSLDSLAQEGGALFRPLFEAYELLTYFRLEPSRIDEVLENRLPSAGNIAKRIDGEYKGMREYLNNHASHLSLGPESMRHLVDPQSGEPGLMIVTRQPFRLRIALVNLQTLFAVFALVGTEGVNCALFGGSPLQSELADRMVELKCRGLAAFDEAIGHLQA
jgi:hypothetical protein